MSEQETKYKHYKQGIACAILSSVLWGLIPVYWKALGTIDSSIIVLYRIFLVAIFFFIVCIMYNKWEDIWKPIKKKGVALTFFISGLLITGNWSIYIWAVANDYVIQTAIGYYIEPLIVCVIGVVFFKEKLSRSKIISVIIIFIAVIMVIIYFGQIPLIALSLAITFALYAAIKKKYQLTASIALIYETMFIAPIAISVIIYLEITGQGVLVVATPIQLGLILFMGAITGVPLLLFSLAANRVPLITLGLTEYIAPSLTLLLGVFVFKEPFDTMQFLCFAVIWIGLGFFTYGEIKEGKELKKEFKDIE